MSKNNVFTSNRRGFLGLMAGGAALSALPEQLEAEKLKTKAKIVILGAGAGGLNMANRMARRLDGASITIIDGREQHWYQPGQSLIGIGRKPASYSISKTTDYIPAGVDLIAEHVAEIDPDGKSVTTVSGKKIKYDYLIVALGIVPNWKKIEGFEVDMIGKEGIACCHAGPYMAEKSAVALHKFAETGGEGVFFRAPSAIKCGGQLLKYTMLTEDITDTKGNRGKSNFTYMAPKDFLMALPIGHQRMQAIFRQRDIAVNYHHKVKAIDHGKKTLTFKTADGLVEMPYDFTHVVPPHKTPDPIVNSPLPWLDKKIGEGWVDTDKYTMQHKRYPEVFTIGDAAGVPNKGKTAAAIKWQAPVIEDHLVAAIQGKKGTLKYSGYTACPMLTRIGEAMLIEFDYNSYLTPSFPGIISPLEKGWVPWIMKTVAFKATYHSMLRGRV